VSEAVERRAGRERPVPSLPSSQRSSTGPYSMGVQLASGLYSRIEAPIAANNAAGRASTQAYVGGPGPFEIERATAVASRSWDGFVYCRRSRIFSRPACAQASSNLVPGAPAAPMVLPDAGDPTKEAGRARAYTLPDDKNSRGEYLASPFDARRRSGLPQITTV